jgi:phosphoribosyl-ATP pyrophosphohydrolase
MFKPLEELVNTIRERKNSETSKSYTRKLLGDQKMCISKVNEEINELIEAIEKNDNQIHEAADVFYHLLVLLESGDIKIEDVITELKRRQNAVRQK